MDSASNNKITMTLCESLRELCKTVIGKTLKEIILNSKNACDIEAKSDKMRIDSRLMQELSSHSISTTVAQVKSVSSRENSRDVEVILMLGGYSDSPMLLEAIKNKFRHLKIVIPKEASSAVMRGAVIFGHKPLSIKLCILRKTYGRKTSRIFDPGLHEDRYKAITGIGVICNNVFDKVVEKGDTVTAGEITQAKSYTPFQHNQEIICVKFYTSDSKYPKYTDQDCQLIGDGCRFNKRPVGSGQKNDCKPHILRYRIKCNLPCGDNWPDTHNQIRLPWITTDSTDMD